MLSINQLGDPNTATLQKTRFVVFFSQNWIHRSENHDLFGLYKKKLAIQILALGFKMAIEKLFYPQPEESQVISGSLRLHALHLQVRIGPVALMLAFMTLSKYSLAPFIQFSAST